MQYLSLDPYMRGRMDDRESYAAPTPLGEVMPGESVATVVASHHPGYSEGDIVLAQTGSSGLMVSADTTSRQPLT
jgi:NADPH-dependent curcumin reductase CurA